MAEAPMREVVQRGLWFEEFEEGVRYLHRPGRTVTEADNVLFTTLTMNPQPLHLDAVYAAAQPFGRVLVNSLFTLSTLVGQSVAQLTLGTLVANLGFGEVAFPNPVFTGDTLSGESTVVSKRLSASRPGQGVVTLAHVARNQDGVVVATASRSMLVWTKEAGERQAASRPAPAAPGEDGEVG
ncbi:MaoC family dehydratase [Agromyces sp. G08B096]|uniref:MaoC family dehydratase n=1 Tax=Agromyces sp. G08B096 TaxID=3156399 RepID=A0AAU7W6D5_9MICO